MGRVPPEWRCSSFAQGDDLQGEPVTRAQVDGNNAGAAPARSSGRDSEDHWLDIDPVLTLRTNAAIGHVVPASMWYRIPGLDPKNLLTVAKGSAKAVYKRSKPLRRPHGAWRGKRSSRPEKQTSESQFPNVPVQE